MHTRPQYLSAEQRRAATVQAVIELAAEQNPAEITTTAIADRMGLTQGAVFRHFPNKESILEATMSWVCERLLLRLDKAAEAADTPTAALEAMFTTHIDFVARHPGVPRMLFGELQRSADTLPKRIAQTLIRQYQQRLRRVMETGKEQGCLDPQLDVAAAAVLFIGTIQGLIMQSLLAGKIDQLRQNAPAVFAIYRRGIACGACHGQ